MNLKKSVPGLSNTHDWFLYDRDLPDERVPGALQPSYPESLFLNVVKHNSLFFLFGFSFRNIRDSDDSREKGRPSLYILSTSSAGFTST